MKMIGFRKNYDKVLVNSKYFYEKNDKEFSFLTKEELSVIIEYLEKNSMVFSKTLSLFDGEHYIGPYMIFSDGEWIWPGYFSYNLDKDKIINTDFLSYVKQKNYIVTPLTKEQKKAVIIFLERELLSI